MPFRMSFFICLVKAFIIEMPSNATIKVDKGCFMYSSFKSIFFSM